jgi:hypothetical protein
MVLTSGLIHLVIAPLIGCFRLFIQHLMWGPQKGDLIPSIHCTCPFNCILNIINFSHSTGKLFICSTSHFLYQKLTKVSEKENMVKGVAVNSGYNIPSSSSSFFCGHYSPEWTLDSFMIAHHWSQSCDFHLQFPMPIIFRSSSTECSHLIAALPADWVPSRSTPILHRGSIFQVPTCKSLILLGRFRCFYLAAIVKSFSTIKAFYGLGLWAPCPNPNLEDKGIPFCLDHHLWPVQHGRLY